MRRPFDDVPSSRRALMGRVHGKDTKPELAVRGAAHRMGFRFRLHRRDMPGTPDLVFPKLKKVIFVHGCFWHRHIGCRQTTVPKARADYWKSKFDANIKRDARNLAELREQGWEALVIWECETSNETALRAHLAGFLTD
ncbi:DNA mismatch endonuclease Vsr [Mesorhizobium sp. B2-4-6]|uniref:very short patch repair endonuclease n=1 Tax=Mesorhizobium sp. B2-4-6 TaxID=2589943 RepID=UPI00112D89D5|nr:DNA mismatch endonuclease Vsr [Mesorhizobium sp. B2-4-6]TPL49892.1 DNA mismatch endonuclease Vsr [Mesorhizobium sp. B2-4-6]